MSATKSRLTVVVWSGILYLVAVCITFSAFLLIVPFENRGTVAYMGLAAVCGAELALFAWHVNMRLLRDARQRISGAVQVTICAMIVVWFVITLVVATQMAAAKAAPPAPVTGGWVDRVIVVYSVLTFAFLVAAVALYAKDWSAQDQDKTAQLQRREMRVRVGDVDNVITAVRNHIGRNPDDAATADRMLTRLNGLRTSLDFALPAKAITPEEDGPSDLHDINVRIQGELNELVAAAAKIPENAPAAFARADSAIERLDALLKDRQRRLLA